MIERIIIENFKSIRKLDLELKPINILVGANGVGKSNFVSFFKLPNLVVQYGIQDYNKDIDKVLYFGRKRSSRMNGIIYFGNNYNLGFAISPRQESNYGVLFPAENDEPKTSEGEWQKKFINWVAVRLSYFDGRIYHFQDVTETSPLKKLSELNDNRYLKEDGRNLASYLYYLQEKHLKDFHNIENQIRAVAPFFDRFDLEPERLNEKQIELRWLEKGSDAYFNAYDLSDGTLRFMALTTLLLQPDLPKTIIIDEPELGLHPFAINKLAAMMKQAAAKGSQVIVSTQSVGLIDNFELEDIITVDREDDQSVFKRLDSEELKDWLEDYTLGELWNKNVIGARP